jgi:hypothetical protein
LIAVTVTTITVVADPISIACETAPSALSAKNSL